MADKKLTPEIESVLRAARIEGNKLYLGEQLHPKVYKEIKTFLVNCGATWSRKDNAHVFKSDPAKLMFALDEGEAIDERKKFQSFFTPIEVAKRAVELAEIEIGNIILEPSAGHGALIDQMLTYDGVHVDAVDLNPEFQDFLEDRYGWLIHLYRGDFLNWKPIDVKDPQIYDRAILNPPFTKFQWISHIEHSYKFLKPGGKLVSITPDALNNKKFQEFVADKDWAFEPVAEKAFAEAGTNIRTNIITINK